MRCNERRQGSWGRQNDYAIQPDQEVHRTAGQLRYKVDPWMLDRQVAHIPVGLAISWLVFLWPLDVPSNVLWGARLTAILLFAGFILYEVTEDEEINDRRTGTYRGS